MYRFWIALAAAAVMMTGLEARAQDNPPAQPDSLLPPPRAPTASKEVTALLKDGDAAMKEQSYIKAMKAYYDAVKAEPGNPDALYRLGLAYEVNGNPKAAALRFRQTLKVDPDYVAAARALARVEGRPVPEPAPTAKGEDATVAPTLPPEAFPPTVSKQVRDLINDGDVAFQKNNFILAITRYLHASQLDPNNEEALYKLGLSYALSKNHQMAIFKWQKVLAINPTNEMAKRNIAIAEQNLKGGSLPYQFTFNR